MMLTGGVGGQFPRNLNWSELSSMQMCSGLFLEKTHCGLTLVNDHFEFQLYKEETHLVAQNKLDQGRRPPFVTSLLAVWKPASVVLCAAVFVKNSV